MIRLLTQTIFTIIIISILGFGCWLAYKPWLKLSEAFGTEIYPPNVFIEQQSCILHNTRIKGWINVGITEQKLYLSHTSPLSYFVKPLLIDLDAITRIETCYEPLLGECYKFLIGNPHITTLVLSQVLIEKLEEDYGEPIFSSKLGELS